MRHIKYKLFTMFASVVTKKIERAKYLLPWKNCFKILCKLILYNLIYKIYNHFNSILARKEKRITIFRF